MGNSTLSCMRVISPNKNSPRNHKIDTITILYLVKVTISDLNVRKGPGTDYAATGKFTGKGTSTIVEESAGAGKHPRLEPSEVWQGLDPFGLHHHN